MRPRRELELGYVLHSFPYRETSLVLEVFLRNRGRLPLLAKGARRPRSAHRGVLLAFQALRFSWTQGSELGLLNTAEWCDPWRPLSGIAMMCGYYVNELLLRLLPREDAHERLFDSYAVCLSSLSLNPEDAVIALRRFEAALLTELGYAPVFDREAGSVRPVDANLRYVYDPEIGPRPVDRSGGTVSGQTLLDLARDDYSRVQTRSEARQLLRMLIDERLGGRPLNTRSVLKELHDL